MRYYPKLTGTKCFLSPVNPDDLEIYTTWLNDPEISVNLDWAQRVISLPTEREALDRICREGRTLAIVDITTQELLGNCGLGNVDLVNRAAEAGIFIGRKDLWGNGYGTDAMMLLLEYGFSYQNLTNIMLRAYAFNTRAVRCYEKCGFKAMGRRRKSHLLGGVAHDEIYMDITSDEFAGSPARPRIGREEADEG